MAANDQAQPFRYPESVREALLCGEAMIFGDGLTITPRQMWEFLSEEGPRRFPGAFTLDRYNGGLSIDVDFLSGVKRVFIAMTHFDRLKNRIHNGMPVVIIQAGGPTEIYLAAQCACFPPGMPLGWLLSQEEGLNRDQFQARISAARNTLKKGMPAECCTIVAPFKAARETGCPIELLAPITVTACSDAVFAMESSRRRRDNFPHMVVDFPAHRTPGDGSVEYVAEQLRRLAERLGELSGTEVTPERLRAEIRRRNQTNQLARECNEIWWEAEVPPTNSEDRLFWGLSDEVNFPVLYPLMIETKAELQQRVARKVLGKGLRPDPLRIFVCGSCANLNPYLVERAGGVIVGREQMLGLTYNDMREDGDPFLSMAESACAAPYELPPVERGEWTAQKVRQARADGVVFIYNWGCNYQSAVSRTVAEVIREAAGVPVLVVDISQSGLLTNAEQMRTRIEAFLEILDHNRSRIAL